MKIIAALVALLAVAASAAPSHEQNLKLHSIIGEALTTGQYSEEAKQTLLNDHNIKAQDLLQCQMELQGIGQAFAAPECQTLFSSYATVVGSGSNLLQTAIEGLCNNPCFPTYLATMRSLFACYAREAAISQNTFAYVTGWFEFMCTKNPVSGIYCAAHWYDSYITGSRLLNRTYCYWYGFEYGCCLRSLIDYYSLITGVTYRNTWTSVLNSCNLTLTPACYAPGNPTRYMAVHWVLTGISYTWFTANADNRQIFLIALRRDIGLHFGVRTEYVSIVRTSQGSIVMDFQIRGDTNTETDSIRASVTAAATTAATFTQVAADVPAAGVEGTIGLNVAMSTVETKTETAVYGTGAGTKMAPSVLVALAAALFALFAVKYA